MICVVGDPRPGERRDGSRGGEGRGGVVTRGILWEDVGVRRGKSEVRYGMVCVWSRQGQVGRVDGQVRVEMAATVEVEQ